MRSVLTLVIALFSMFALPQLTGCAGSESTRATGQVIDDASITARVKTAIFKESGVSATAVNVDTYRGVVQLSGFVESEAAIQRAAQAARSVPGVNSVENALRVAPAQAR